jgi:urocanate hydratase
MLFWDVNNGIARRAWARNDGAIEAIKSAMEKEERLVVTLPQKAKDQLIDSLFIGE